MGGWVLMGLFWATFLGLVLWAVSRLFGRAGGRAGVDGAQREVSDADDLDLRLARGELDLSQYRTLRPMVSAQPSPLPAQANSRLSARQENQKG